MAGVIRLGGAEALPDLFPVDYRLLGIQLLDAHRTQGGIRLVKSGDWLADRHSHDSVAHRNDLCGKFFLENR